MAVISEARPGSMLQQFPEMKIISKRKKKIYSTRYTLANKLDGKLTLDERKAAHILQELDISNISEDKPLSMNEKGLLFFAYLWHETRNLDSIKRFEDVREDFVDRMFDSFDDRISATYERFYDLYAKATEGSRIQEFVSSLKKGLTLEESAEEAEISEENPLFVRLQGYIKEDGHIEPEVLGSVLKQIKNEKKRKPKVEVLQNEVKRPVSEEEFVRQIKSGTPFRNPEKERVESNKNADISSPLQKRILEMKKKRMSREQITRETGEEPGTVELNISILIFIGALSPQPSTARRSEEFKAFCLEVERVYVEHPDWDYGQVAKELTTTRPQVKMARMILMGAKKLQPIMGAKERHRTEENIENEQAIYGLRRTELNLSQTQIAKRLGLSLWIVQHYIARGVNKELIPRKRPLPNRSKPQ